MKIKKIYYLLFLLFFLEGCGYTPIYSKIENNDYKFNIIDIKGETEMTNLVISNIKKYSKNSGNKIIDIKIKTNYQKNILTKNKEGEATNYLIINEIEFETVNLTNNKIFTFEEKTKTASMNDQFEFMKYENNIRNNFINSKLQEFILKLSEIE